RHRSFTLERPLGCRHFRDRHTLERLHDRTLTLSHDHNLTCERVNYRVGVESFTHGLVSYLELVRVSDQCRPRNRTARTAPADRLPALRAGAHGRVFFCQKILIYVRGVRLAKRALLVLVLPAAPCTCSPARCRPVPACRLKPELPRVTREPVRFRGPLDMRGRLARLTRTHRLGLGFGFGRGFGLGRA